MLRTLVRIQRSDSLPNGTPTAAYSKTNAVFNQPTDESLSPHSFLIGSVTAARICRSKKFIILMPNRIHSAYVALPLFCMHDHLYTWEFTVELPRVEDCKLPV